MTRSTIPSRETITTTAYTSNFMLGTSSITSEERSFTATYVGLMTLTSTTYPAGNPKFKKKLSTHLLLP